MEEVAYTSKPVGEDNKGKVPTEDSSPYTDYKDLEDYKQQGYGTQGKLQPQPGRGAGTTDAPTLSGASNAAASQPERSPATDTGNRQGVP